MGVQQGHERLDLAARPRGQPRHLGRAGQSLAEGNPVFGGERLHHGFGAFTDPTTGHVQDAPDGDVVGRVGDRTQVGDQVTDLTTLVELDAAHHPVGQPDSDEDLFKGPRLGVRPVEHRDLPGPGSALVGQSIDLFGDEACLVVFGVGHIADQQVAVPGFRPQSLLGPARVLRDHRVRCGEDVLGGAIVLLQHDRGGTREVLGEVEDVADRRPSEGVDRLVGVAHHHQFRRVHHRVPRHGRMGAAEFTDQRVLRVVGVLILIDQHVPEPPAVLLTQVGERLQQMDGGHDQVVEIKRVGRHQAALIQPVRLGEDLLIGGGGTGGRRLVVDQLVLARRDPIHHASDGVALGVDPHLPQYQLHQPFGVGVVVDGERARQPEPADVGAEDPDARGVEGRHPHQPSPVADQIDHPLAHLGGGLVGERDRQDRTGMDVALPDQVGDPPGQHPGLAGSGPGDHEHRAAGMQHRLPLWRVESLQQHRCAPRAGGGRVHRRRCGRRGRSEQVRKQGVGHGADKTTTR